jgi:hypothetical protein
MLSSPTFRYFYLPWSLAVVLQVIVVGYQQIYKMPTEQLRIEDEVVIPMPENCDVSVSPPFCTGCITDGSTDNPLSEWIMRRLKLPAGSGSHRTAGLAEVNFVVGPDGLVRDARLSRDPGHGRGADLLEAFRAMERLDIRWQPAVRENTCTGKRTNTSRRMYYRVRYNMVWAGAPTSR